MSEAFNVDPAFIEPQQDVGKNLENVQNGPEGPFFNRKALKKPDQSKLYNILQDPDVTHEDRAAALVFGALHQLGLVDDTNEQAILAQISYAHVRITHPESNWSDESRIDLYEATQGAEDTPLIEAIESMLDVTNAHTDIITEADTLARLLIFQEISED